MFIGVNGVVQEIKTKLIRGIIIIKDNVHTLILVMMLKENDAEIKTSE